MPRTSTLISIVAIVFLSLLAIWALARPATQAQNPVVPAVPGVPKTHPEVPKANPEVAKTNLADTMSLPITRVVLFTSGVAYFERSGEVDGNGDLELSFRVSDISDLLKNLMVQDLGGGRISPVGYESYDPLSRTLKSYALDLTNNPTFAQLLNQARGEKVEIAWQGQAYKGTVVGVEHQRQPAGKEAPVEVDVLDLLTAEGLRTLPLQQVQHVRFLNPILQNDLQKALDVVASARDTHKRTVSLHFRGQGKRQVRVAYVLESPVWQTSYRLAMGKDKLDLQGWGLVNNATDEDWHGVQVTLVSGRPISFQMDLYTPLYVPRPVVRPELFANLRSPIYGGAMDGAANETAKDSGFRMQDRSLALRAMAAMAAPGASLRKAIAEQQGLPPLARGTELGDFFQYTIEQPIDLPRQKAAMLPILNQEMEGTKYSIYDARVLPKHPLLGLKLKNTSKLHLMQGPITVFEGNSYAGDARISDIEPKEDRLISYAVDLGTEVDPVGVSAPDQLLAVKIIKGILHATSRIQQTKIYNIKNRSTHDRVLLVEHPIRPGWKLTSAEKPVESSRDVYRFLVTVPAGKSASLKVVEEQSRASELILTNTSDQTLRLYLTSTIVSPKMKEALERASAFQTKLAETRQELTQTKQHLQDIVTDQTRIRADMERLPENSTLFQRYMKKLDGQETQVEKLQAMLGSLRQEEDVQRKKYEAFLESLDIE